MFTQINYCIDFFMEQTGCDARTAGRLAAYAVNIIDSFDNVERVDVILYGIRNAYFLGQENA